MTKHGWPDWDVYVRDRAACVYCGLDGKTDLRHWRQLQIDHLIPVKSGGPDCASNKVVSCTRCNVLKGASDPRQLLDHGNEAPFAVLVAAARKVIEEAAIRQNELRDYESMMMDILGAGDRAANMPMQPDRPSAGR